MNHSLKTRAMSFLLAAVMVFGMLPMPAMAEENIETTAPTETTAVVSEETVMLMSDDDDETKTYVTVIFDAQNGTDPVEQSVESGTAVTKPEDPAFEGYTFQGWYNGETAWDFEAPVTDAVTLTAKWEEVTAPATTHAVTFKAANGTENVVVNVEAGTPVAEPAEPVYEGYTFQGWYNGDVKWDFTTAITADVTLVAVWEENKDSSPDNSETVEYTVAFDSAGGSAVEPQTVAAGETVEKPADPTYEGFVFQGWYNGTEAWTFDTAVAGDMTLTAVWVEDAAAVDVVEYTITFNANNGTNATATQTVSDTVALDKNTFTYADHEFTNWNTAANGSGQAYKDGEEVTLTGDLVLYAQWKDVYYKTISHKTYDLAPGIVESEIVLNNAAGTHRQVAHVVEVDIHNEYTKVIPSYKGMIPTPGSYGVQVMSKQAAYAEANGYGNVVAAMNISLSWYDSAYYLAHPELVGEPLGYMILDGVPYINSQGQTAGAQTCLVINFDEKDGVARPSNMPKTEIRSSASAITGWEEQVIPANFGFLVKDGKNQYSENHTTDPASRSFVGIKADGSIVMVMNDGRQSPYSAGFNSYEMAEFMLSLGCVHAVNGDGGGSSTFLSQRPGEELKLNCRPSDGAERDTTHGILVISTAPSTGEFVRASITSEEEYYTPNSSVQFTAQGTDLVGTATEIPAEAVWQLADESFGTIENGLFVSTGKEGVVTVQLVYNGAVVGQDTVNIVMPDTLSFAQENMVIPYGKTVDMGLSATYNYKNVVLKPEDVEFTLDNNTIGTIAGFALTAAAEGVENTKAVLTAKVGEVSVSTNISLGKGSEIAYDFEDQNLENWTIYTNYPQYGPTGPNGNVKDEDGNYWYHGQNERGYLSIVNNATGKVKNGNYALAVECDFSQIYETGFHALNMRFPKIDVTDALSVGFWIYVPYDARYSDLSINTVLGETAFGGGSAMDLCEGWHYMTLSAPAAADGFYGLSINVDERAASPDASGKAYYDHINAANLDAKFTFYIDDITVDYSSAVEDRENPVFAAPMVLSSTGETSAKMSGQTINYNTVTFEAAVAENTEKTNATGLNAASAKAYIDGVAVKCVYSGGKITIPSVVLADGFHTAKFAISDNNGNSSWISGDINVAAGSDASTVKVVPQNPDADRLLIGSLYWMDVVATDIETIDKVELTLDMNNSSQWELEGMTTAAGFSASYRIQKDDNIAKITITRTGKNTATGEAVLASFPVRTWESTITEYEGYTDQTPAKLVSRGIIWKKAIEIELQRGLITFVEGTAPNTTGTFGMEDVLVDTEIFFTNYTRKSVAGAEAQIAAWKAAGTGWHEHTATALEDKPATCTESGYCGRFYCAVCDSVTSWGATIPTTDHVYSIDETDGLAKCTCGDLLTGTLDGVEFVNGIAQNGWVDNSFYRDGIKLTGVQKVPAHDSLDEFYYDFGQDGECADREKFTGLFYDDDAAVYRYSYLGELSSGWKLIGEDWHYFAASTMSALVGEHTFEPATYVFDETGKVTSGVWVENANGRMYWYGPSCYSNGWQEIDGDTYFFWANYCVTGYYMVKITPVAPPQWYHFADDGVLIGQVTDSGLLKHSTGLYYLENGLSQSGLFLIDGYYYYFSSGDFKAIVDRTYTVNNTNGLNLPKGEYTFDAEGRIIFERKLVEENGGLFYYVNDVLTSAGLIEMDGHYYYIRSNGQAAVGRYYVTRPNGLMEAGYYDFGADGKMIIETEEEKKNGLVEENGGLFYYVDGDLTAAGLIELDGHYYYIRSNGQAAVGRYYVTRPNGLMEENGGLFYYVDGELTPAGLIELDGYYYYIRSNGQAAVGRYYVTRPNGLMEAGYYDFGADGKMIIETEEEKKNGLVEENGGLFYYVDGELTPAGLIELDGHYYYIRSNGQAAVGKYYVTRPNGLMNAGYYEFGADGRLIQG